MTFEKPYFFVPATKLKKLKTLIAEKNLEVIIDFEDAIAGVEIQPLLELKPQDVNWNKIWCRIPINNEIVLPAFLSVLIEWGIKKWVIPKLASASSFEKVLAQMPHGQQYIILIETPRLYVELQKLLDKYSTMISAIGLGSHDFMISIGAEHNLEILKPARFHIRVFSEAYNIEAIDIASMNISSQAEFLVELEHGQSLGYKSKFLLHPNQLHWYKAFRREEILRQLQWADKVLSIGGGALESEVQAFMLDGLIIEKPHLNKAIEIIKKYRK
jgi:citrate lyase beta subunit